MGVPEGVNDEDGKERSRWQVAAGHPVHQQSPHPPPITLPPTLHSLSCSTHQRTPPHEPNRPPNATWQRKGALTLDSLSCSTISVHRASGLSAKICKEKQPTRGGAVGEWWQDDQAHCDQAGSRRAGMCRQQAGRPRETNNPNLTGVARRHC